MAEPSLSAGERVRRFVREYVMLVLVVSGIVLAYELGGSTASWAFWAGMATLFVAQAIRDRLLDRGVS